MISKQAGQIRPACQRVEKVNLQISTRWQTSRNGTEFRFLAKEDVRWYLDWAKNEKRQKRHKFDIYAAFQIFKSLKK